MNKKTISYLNSKIWYRFLKVVFCFSILASILIFNGFLIMIEGIKNIDNDKTLIYCLYKDKKVFSPKQINITLSADYLKNGFNYQDFFEGDNIYITKAILQECYGRDVSLYDIYVIQRLYEIMKNKKELSEEDERYLWFEIEKITEGFKTNSQKSAEYLDYSVKLFDIKPVYSYAKFIKLFIMGNTIILLFFEALRRVFYYIVLGTIRPSR